MLGFCIQLSSKCTILKCLLQTTLSKARGKFAGQERSWKGVNKGSPLATTHIGRKCSESILMNKGWFQSSRRTIIAESRRPSGSRGGSSDSEVDPEVVRNCIKLADFLYQEQKRSMHTQITDEGRTSPWGVWLSNENEYQIENLFSPPGRRVYVVLLLILCQDEVFKVDPYLALRSTRIVVFRSVCPISERDRTL